MNNSFKDYIQQLQDFETAENVASLKAFREINEGLLKYFPSIWDCINRLIESNSVTYEIYQDIKNKVPTLSNCKKYHIRLKNAPISQFYSTAITDLLSHKDIISLAEIVSYESDLTEMLSINESKFKQEEENRKQKIGSEAAAKENLEGKEKKKTSTSKGPKQYLSISFIDLSKDEFIDVLVDGIKDSSRSKYVENKTFGRSYYDTMCNPICLTNDEHIISFLFRQGQFKLEIIIPKIDFSKEKRGINQFDYFIHTDSLFKTWNLDPTTIKVDARLGEKDGWSRGKKIKPQYKIVYL